MLKLGVQITYLIYLNLCIELIKMKMGKISGIFAVKSSTIFSTYSGKSDKITRYGDRTFEMMDYLGMLQRTALPFKDYHLVIPDTKSSWTDKAPMYQTCFIPEVDLSGLQQWRWVDFVKNDLSKHK